MSASSVRALLISVSTVGLILLTFFYSSETTSSNQSILTVKLLSADLGSTTLQMPLKVGLVREESHITLYYFPWNTWNGPIYWNLHNVSKEEQFSLQLFTIPLVLRPTSLDTEEMRKMYICHEIYSVQALIDQGKYNTPIKTYPYKYGMGDGNCTIGLHVWTTQKGSVS